MSYEIRVKAMLENTEAMATTLFLILDKQYGDDWLEWDPSTVYLELRDDFGVECASEVGNRIAALQVILTTGNFFTYNDAFAGICNTLADGSPSFSVFDPVTGPEIAWAVAEVSLLRELLPFEYSIKQYIHLVLKSEGVADEPPGILTEILDDPTPEADAVVDALVEDYRDKTNNTEIEVFIDDQISDIYHQTRKLGLDDEFNKLLKRKELENIANMEID